jgi:hypothetical protein
MAMRLYTVHVLPGDPDPGETIVLVEEGFCWPAFLLSPLWALWHRLWLVALLLLAVGAAVSGAAYLLGPDPISHGAASLGTAVLIGYFANDLRRWTLERRGYRLDKVVSGAGADEALGRYLDRAHP